jgi:hypothetical protein
MFKITKQRLYNACAALEKLLMKGVRRLDPGKASLTRANKLPFLAAPLTASTVRILSPHAANLL